MAGDVPALRTERLLLRAFAERDRPAWAAIHADPEVMATLGPMLDRAAADAFLDGVMQRWEEQGYGWWCVDLDGECIGAAGVNTPSWPAPFRVAGGRVFELGWRIASPHWGRGYAPEAARAAARFGFEVLDAPEIVAFTAASNTKSRRVMDKIGMVSDPSAAFDHPNLEAGHPLRRHVLYRLARPEWAADR